MPLGKLRGNFQEKPPQTDPLTACLDANGTYICTAYNPRCYIIQKVTPNANANATLNPNADIFESKEEGAADVPASVDTSDDDPSLEGYVYMNGDVGKLPSGVACAASPEPLATAAAAATSSSEYSSMNGIAESLEPYTVASPPPPLGVMPPTIQSPGPPSMPLDQLKQMLSSQLEYYFSRENLANDAYLLSQMDNDQYVPIWTVANFNQVKKLTKDIKLITEVLRESPNVQVDEEGQKVRPNHKRCIVILREIPDNTPLEEVKNLFSGEGCPRLISCEFAHNNSWYVTFESDEDAQRAYRFLREEVREFQGKPIMARIKAKPMNRLPMPAVPAMGATMKNGYRTTPPPPMYDQNPGYQNQQRFLYSANGTSIPPTVNYGNQVQIYTFPQQPFYPPSMLQPWGAANPTYFDIGSVFTVNGLAPQGSFSKQQTAKYTMPRRNKRTQPNLADNANMSRQPGYSQSFHRVNSPGASGSASISQSVKSASTVNTAVGAKSSSVVSGVATDNHHNHSKSHHQMAAADASDASSQCQVAGSTMRSDSEDSYRQSRETQLGKELMPPRHRRRRKEDEPPLPGGRAGPLNGSKFLGPGGDGPQVPSVPPMVRGPQFDLEATAFPPLPGLDGGTANSGASTKPSSAVPQDPQPPEPPSNSHWENRLSDVVKGTAKPKTTHSSSTKDKENMAVGCPSPRDVSPASPTPRPTPPSATAKVEPPTSQSPLPGTAQSPAPPTSDSRDTITAQPSSITLTPPNSPDKTVPLAKHMADKSTKTDDTLLNGDGSPATSSRKTLEVSSSKDKPCPLPTTSLKPVPTTTNAATMTSAVVVTDVTSTQGRSVATTSTSMVATPTVTPASSVGHADYSAALTDGGPARLSYAQVAQHHKEKVERMMREKQSTDALQEKEVVSARVSNQHGDFREVGPGGRGEGRYLGRGGPRPFDRDRTDGGPHGGFRRRDGPAVPRFREFIHPRSPK